MTLALPPRQRAPLSLRDEVLRGLLGAPKTLPAKLFYDEAGAALFEQICELDEYYLTRTELGILRARAADIAAIVGPEAALVEYGSGAGVKVRLVLDALEAPAAYVPVDISSEQLSRVAREIAGNYPTLAVHPVCADFGQPLRLPPVQARGNRVAFFPGSTIGNFHPAEAAAFLRRVRHTLGPGGLLLLGVDRLKDPAVLEAAYNDRRGVTAAFNRNMLVHLNRVLGATFRLPAFAHRAPWNAEASRIEMHLESLIAQTVTVAGVPVRFAQGETIWTECSYKYDAPRLASLAESAGFTVRARWTDAADLFWVTLLEVADRP